MKLQFVTDLAACGITEKRSTMPYRPLLREITSMLDEVVHRLDEILTVKRIPQAVRRALLDLRADVDALLERNGRR
jgi:hypothetical protein